jgi:hypothetical protein
VINVKTTSTVELWRSRGSVSFDAALFEGHVVRTVAPTAKVKGTGVSIVGYRADTDVFDPQTAQMLDVVVDDNPGFRTWSPPS